VTTPEHLEAASDAPADEQEEGRGTLADIAGDALARAAAALAGDTTDTESDDTESPDAASEDPAAADTGEGPEAEAAAEAEDDSGDDESDGEPDAADVDEASAAADDAAPEASDADDAEGAEDAAEILPPPSPYDLPGGWYVIHSYSGYENKVKANLSTRITSMHKEESIFDVVIPMEDVVEIKGGRKVTVPKKQFPGYLLVRMYMDDDAWAVVRNTPGVTGFVGSGTKPTPLSRREVERILGVRKDEEKKTPRFKPDWEVGETVRVIDGPFADFNGVIEDINVDQSKVRVLVDIFGRETPVELNFEQIQKF
jgi:transcriptional antiterminator NusG